MIPMQTYYLDQSSGKWRRPPGAILGTGYFAAVDGKARRRS